jgi:chemotaxis signal transduction protein
MDSTQILAEIELSQKLDDQGEVATLDDTKYIIFTAGTRLYALLADDVQEIMLGSEIHYLPFLPPFVRGLINRLGEPLTVLDLDYLLQGRPLQGKAFIILKPHLSKMALLIDAVQDITRVPATSIRSVAEGSQGQDAYVGGVFARKDGDVILLSLEHIIAAVRKAVDVTS